MPLYIDNETIRNSFCLPVADAMLEIKAEMDRSAVTPSFALKLIKMHLRSLVPEEHLHIIDKQKSPSWDDVFGVYVELGFESRENEVLSDVVRAVRMIHKYTKTGRREFIFPNTVDVTHFLHTCGFLKIPAQELRRDDRNDEFDLFRFCKYCWRLPASGRHLCLFHSSGDKNTAPDTTNGFSKYKEGRRQQLLFDKALNRLLTDESIEFHQSSFAAQIIPPSTDISTWLAVRRPKLWDALGLKESTISDAEIIKALLMYLHDPNGLPFSTQQMYEIANTRISQHSYLIGPMLARAEAWLMVRTDLNKRWGGARAKSGRKKAALE